LMAWRLTVAAGPETPRRRHDRASVTLSAINARGARSG
jgi:hypothetical protein